MDAYEKTIHWPLSPRFWETGRVYAKGRIENGWRQGQWTFWFRSGVKQMEGPYENGVKQGQWTKWWPNGSIASQGAFKKGRMHGLWTDYFRNGEKAQESHWDHGKKAGKTTVWDLNGKVVKTEVFDPSREKATDYTLMTDRDVAYALAMAQKQGIAMAWRRLIGARVSKYMEPWHGALWLLLMVPIYKIAAPRMGWPALFAALGGATVLAAAAAFLGLMHDHMTKPDYGVNPGKPGP